MKYNLNEEGWVPVADEPEQFSTPEIFERAPELTRLSCELPSMDVAVLRLLVAIVLVAYADPEWDDADAREAWLEAWSDWTVLRDRVIAYLDDHHDQFDLFHPERPFLQSATLEPVGELPPGLDRLVAGDGGWFNVREAGKALTPGEAARWVLHTQAYGLAGIQTGQKEDETVKGGKGYPSGYPAWCGNFSAVVWQGRDLAKTILLNTPLEVFPSEGRAGWQIPQPVHSRRDDKALTPAGPAELMVWPNRRIRLHPDPDGLVRRVQVSYGDLLTPQNKSRLEPMAIWRRSEAQSKKAGQDVLMPWLADPSQQVWRGLGTLFATRTQSATGDWLAGLIDNDDLDGTMPVRLQVIGVSYGPQNSSIQTITEDSIGAPLVALVSARLVGIAGEAVQQLRPCVGAVTGLASDLCRATGNSNEDTARERAARTAYAALDPHYRAWLAGMDDPERYDQYVAEWLAIMRREFLAVGRSLVAAAGDRGLRGRVVDGHLLTSSAAWAHFERRILGLTKNPDRDQPQEES